MVDANQQSVVQLEDLDFGFRDEIAAEPGGEMVRFCFQCGTCTASCPVRAVEDRFNPRRIIRMAMLGMKKDVLTSSFVWLCSSCYACQQRCPQGVKITGIMGALKNVAVRNGLVPAMFAGQVASLRLHGRVYEVGELENEKRAKLGLPQITEMPDEIRRILDMTGAEALANGGAPATAPSGAPALPGGGAVTPSSAAVDAGSPSSPSQAAPPAGAPPKGGA
jgi:heterodisulfide reductase subunit C